MSEWTIDTLKEHFESLNELSREALRLQAIEYERRLHLLNNEHERLEKSALLTIPRGEYLIQHQALIDRVVKLENLREYQVGQLKGVGAAGSLLYMTLLALAAATSIWAYMFFHTH